jgi:mono/diheme cytochrome c family protein
MKKVILAVLLIAVALFLLLPNLSWAQSTEEIYRAKCAACHGADGKGSAGGKKMGVPEFSSATVQKASDAEIADYIENGGPQHKASHAFASKGVSASESSKLAVYVKSLK